jgi:squalene-associated FAD-dependent desaturase
MPKIARVGIVGGGIAGLATATALVDRNIEVELFEADDRLGGRACNLPAGDSTPSLESCQQVGAGADLNLARFLAQIGAAQDWEVQTRRHFYAEDGKRSDLYPLKGFPAPLHLAAGFFRLGLLKGRERWSVAKTLFELANPLGEQDADLSVHRWLRLHDQSPSVITRFWEPLLASSLGTTLDVAGLAIARSVLLERYLLHRSGCALRVPKKGMREALAEPAERWLQKCGAKIHTAAKVRLILGSADRCQGLLLASGATVAFDLLVAAVPWYSLGEILSENLRNAIPSLAPLAQSPASTLTFADLWFDRPLSPLSYITSTDGVIDRIFRRHSRATADLQSSGGFHYQVILNPSYTSHLQNGAQTTLEIRNRLAKIWPASRDAELIRSRVVTHPKAHFLSSQEFELLRLSQTTTVPNLMLAGDWTKTGKPSSLEGAVKSGYLAAEAVLGYLGCPAQLVVQEPSAEWLARWLFRLD